MLYDEEQGYLNSAELTHYKSLIFSIGWFNKYWIEFKSSKYLSNTIMWLKLLTIIQLYGFYSSLVHKIRYSLIGFILEGFRLFE